MSEGLKLFFDLLLVVLTCGLVVAAFLALDGWKDQAIGTRKRDLYQEMLAMFYEGEEKIAEMRVPMFFEFEVVEACRFVAGGNDENVLRGIELMSPKNRRNARLMIPLLRHDTQLDFWRRFRARRHLLRANGDPELVAALDEIDTVRKDLLISFGTMKDTHWINRDDPEDMADFDNRWVVDPHYGTAFWTNDPRRIERPDDPQLDELSKRAKEAVAEAEAVCFEHLRDASIGSKIGNWFLERRKLNTHPISD